MIVCDVFTPSQNKEINPYISAFYILPAGTLR